MKKCTIHIACVLVIVAAAIWIFCQLQNLPKEKSPQGKKEVPLTELKFDTKTSDVGVIPLDTIVKATYIMKNSGINPLVIYYVIADCNCTSYELSKKIIQPNDTAKLVLAINTKGKDEGKQTLRTTMRANTLDELYLLTTTINIQK